VKRIRNSRATRILSWLLTWVMVIPLFSGLATPAPASAQATTAPVGQGLTAIVIDFVNKSGIGGDTLARFATDAVAVELASSQRFEVLRREEVSRAAETLGFRVPYDQAQLSRLAQQLGANAVITGEVAFARVNDKKGQEKSVDVGMRVRVVDPTSGELINGAAQLASAVAKPGLTDNDALAQEAVGKAAVYAVRDIVSYTLPTGIILNTVGSGDSLQVLINRGSRDGIVQGQDMIVLRDGTRVGRLRITNVFPTDSEARVVDLGVGVRPQDTVRAVFPLPDLPEKVGDKPRSRSGRSGNALSTLGKFLLIVGVAVLVATAIKGGGSVSGVTAEADYVNNAPAVQVRWKDNLFGGNTLEYHLWRTPDDPFNFQGTPVAAVQLARSYTDFPAPYSYWDANRAFLQPLFNPGNNQGGGGTATTVTPPLGAIPGFVVGRTYVYQVSAVVRRTSTTTGGTGGGGQQTLLEDVETNPVSSGPTTPINPPLLDLPRAPAANVNLTSAVFTWLTRAGADTYVLELSSDRTFMNRNAITQLGPFFSTSTNAEGIIMPQPATPINLSTNEILRRDPLFLAFVNRVPGAQRPTVWFRVGARNSVDQPGPVDWFKRQGADKQFRYIYSEPRSFTPADLPPPPP
jgi:hypothetical protein